MNRIFYFISNNKNLTRLLGLIFLPFLILLVLGWFDILLTSIKIFVIFLIYFYIVFIGFKLLFPYLDFKSLYDKATESVLASAIIFVGTIISLTIILVCVLNILFR